MSHFKLTQQLFPLLQKAKELRGEARIVNHSSMARNGGLLKAEYFGKGGNLGGNDTGAKWERYHQSKLANPVFTLALKDKLNAGTAGGSAGILALCAAPGYSATSLQTTSQGMSGMMWTRWFSQSAEDGTMPLLECCFGTSVQSGDFIEPSQMWNSVGPAVKVQLTKECTDEASRKMLWETSEKACGKFL